MRIGEILQRLIYEIAGLVSSAFKGSYFLFFLVLFRSYARALLCLSTRIQFPCYFSWVYCFFFSFIKDFSLNAFRYCIATIALAPWTSRLTVVESDKLVGVSWSRIIYKKKSMKWKKLRFRDDCQLWTRFVWVRYLGTNWFAARLGRYSGCTMKSMCGKPVPK